MLSDRCLEAYKKMYPKGSIGYLEPGFSCSIETPDDRFLVEPEGETDERFMERLSRCTPERNVFLEEWPEDDTDYSLDVDF